MICANPQHLGFRSAMSRKSCATLSGMAQKENPTTVGAVMGSMKRLDAGSITVQSTIDRATGLCKRTIASSLKKRGATHERAG